MKVSVQDMISKIRAKFDISDEQALYIKEVTEEKTADPIIHEKPSWRTGMIAYFWKAISRTGQRGDSEVLRSSRTL